MVRDVDEYLEVGCGRCSLHATPQCKVNTWRELLVQLRRIANECGVTEESKWGVPCYTYNGANIFNISAFKGFCSLSFFKGSLLKDDDKLLEAPGKNSQAWRQFRFTEMTQIEELEPIIKAYIFEAIEIEKAGLKVESVKVDSSDYPEELVAKFDEDPAFQTAFEALTPGRQRGYLIHFNGAKQSQTRVNRIEKFTSKIMEGKGWQER
ncbi:MAG: YdeI/OmpD-associated family protein [Flavobacteriia bacterium]|nr:YdeI/OmpD-associated family protein [Flavobacteriia bacterium]